MLRHSASGLRVAIECAVDYKFDGSLSVFSHWLFTGSKLPDTVAGRSVVTGRDEKCNLQRAQARKSGM